MKIENKFDKKNIIREFQSMKPSFVFKKIDFSKLPKEIRDKMKGDLSGVSDDTLDLQFEQSTFKKWIETFADLYPAAFGIKEEAKVVSVAPVAKVEPVVKAEPIVVAEEKPVDTSELETKIKDLETRLSVVNKMILKQPLKKTELKIRVKTIEKMIAKFKEELKKTKTASKKKVLKKSLGGFLFGALGGFIAGQLVDLKLQRKKVRFDLGGTLEGDKKYQYSVTYQTITPESAENGDFDDSGFEVEKTIDELQDILQEAVNRYGIYEPSSTKNENGISSVMAGCWWSSVSPDNDRDYFEKGIEKYYSLHIYNVDGSELTQEESQFITNKLKEGRKLHWDEEEKNWWKDGGEIHSKDTDGTLVFKADTKGGKYSIEVREGASGNLMNYDIRDYTNGSLRGMSFISNKELLMHKLIDTILGSKKIDGINYIISHDDLGVKEYLPASEKIWDIYNSAEFREWFKKQNETLTEEQKQSLSDELKNKAIKYVRDNGYKQDDSTIGTFFQLFRKERLIKDFYESKGMVMLKDGGELKKIIKFASLSSKINGYDNIVYEDENGLSFARKAEFERGISPNAKKLALIQSNGEVIKYENIDEIEKYETLTFKTREKAEQNEKEIKDYFDSRFIKSEVLLGKDERGNEGFYVKYQLKKELGDKFENGGDVQTQKWLSNMNQERINELKEQRAKIEKEMPEDYKETSGGSGRTKAEILADFDRHISERENKEFADGGSIGFIPMELEEDLAIISRRGGLNSVKDVIGILNAMIDSGLTDEDLLVPSAKTGTQYEKQRDLKTIELWNKIQDNYKGDLKGNQYYSAINLMVYNKNSMNKNLLEEFKPFRSNQKFANGGGVYSIPYDTETTGVFKLVADGVNTTIRLAGAEKNDSDTYAFYQFDTDRNEEIGSIIINNKAINKLSKGVTVIGIGSKNGIKYKITRVSDVFENGGDFEKALENLHSKASSSTTPRGKNKIIIPDTKYVAVHETKDGIWTIASKPTTKENAEAMLGGTPKNEVGKVVTIEEALNHKKVIGEEYLKMKDGGAINSNEKQRLVEFILNDILSKNPDVDESKYRTLINFNLGKVKKHTWGAGYFLQNLGETVLKDAKSSVNTNNFFNAETEIAVSKYETGNPDESYESSRDLARLKKQPLGNKFAKGGGVEDKLEEILPKEKLLFLLKNTKFKSFDSSEIENNIEYESQTYNPFDKNFVAQISAYPCLIKIQNIDSVYEVRIAKNSGWVGGISYGNWDYVFEIPTLNYQEFEKGLKKAVANKNIVLYSKWNSGGVHDFYFVGSIEQAKKFAKKNGYEEKVNGDRIYFYNPSMPSWKDEKILIVGTFTERQIEKGGSQSSGGIKKLEKEYSKGGGLSSDNTPKVYIADLAAYNEGSLVGEWLDLSEFGSGEEVMEKISELLKQWSEEAGEEREEYSVHDMENFPKQMYSEGMGESSFQKVIDYWEAINGTDYPMEVVEEFASLTGEDVTDAVSKMKDAYYGKFDSVDDFAREYVDSVGGIEGVSNPERYIDISETDKSIVASEQADSDVANMSDDDVLERADLKETYDNFIERADELGEDEELDDDDRVRTLESEFGYSNSDEILEEAKENIREEISSEWEKGLRDPYNFLVEEQGLYDSSSIMKANFIRFDYNQFGKDLEQDYYTIEHDGDVYVFSQNYKKGGSLPSSRSLGVSIEKIEIDIPEFRPEKLKEQTKTNKKPKTMAKKSAGSSKNKERMTLIQSEAKKIWAEGKLKKYSEAVSLASKKLKKEGKL